MPAYTYECERHGIFEVRCRLAEWTIQRKCPKCKKPSEQVHLPSDSRNCEVPPIVVHVAADGSVRFPGASDARVPEGFERKELRTIREIEHFERQMNAKLRSEASQHNEREERFFSELHAQNRSDLRQRMMSMSTFGREFARMAIEMNNRRKSKKSDVGFFVDILHNNQSNREPYRDARTGWKKKYF
jgi:hypothetical protein